MGARASLNASLQSLMRYSKGKIQSCFFSPAPPPTCRYFINFRQLEAFLLFCSFYERIEIIYLSNAFQKEMVEYNSRSEGSKVTLQSHFPVYCLVASYRLLLKLNYTYDLIDNMRSLFRKARRNLRENAIFWKKYDFRRLYYFSSTHKIILPFLRSY